MAQVDFCYDVLKIVIEVSGQRWHSSRMQVQRDAVRRRNLQLAGYLVLDFTYEDIVERPDEVIALIVAARRQRLAA